MTTNFEGAVVILLGTLALYYNGNHWGIKVSSYSKGRVQIMMAFRKEGGVKDKQQRKKYRRDVTSPNETSRNFAPSHVS